MMLEEAIKLSAKNCQSIFRHVRATDFVRLANMCSNVGVDSCSASSPHRFPASSVAQCVLRAIEGMP